MDTKDIGEVPLWDVALPEAEKPFAFVLMPLDPAFDDIYSLGIKAAADEVGVIAQRVDEQQFSETILTRIYRQIRAADFIIADMTGKNANVFYEVGYAHATDKLCTLLTQSASDIPFDLRHHRHLIYDGSINKLKDQLRIEIEWLKKERSKLKSETMSVLVKDTTGILLKSSVSADAEVTITLDITNISKRRAEIEAIYFHTGGGWVFKQGADQCPSTSSGLDRYTLRHFIKAPVGRLSPGTWAPLKLVGKKQLWWRFDGIDVRDSYRLTGNAMLEIVTSDGNHQHEILLDITVDEIPF